MYKTKIIDKLDAAFKLNNESLLFLSQEALLLRLPENRSNTIGSQLACVARARDAYTKAILNDAPFSWNPDFPYDQRYDHNKLANHLNSKSSEYLEHINRLEAFSENQLDLIMDLISHEYLHQGQLIRYFYGNHITMPRGIKSFWHLED